MNMMSVTPSRESELESGGGVKGLALAIVTQNKDPEGLCRVKVRFPWHEKATESYWARLAIPMSGKDMGLVLIPEVGDELLVGFEREDVRFPYVLGALWNGEKKPPLANTDGKNDKKIWKTRKKHYLLFDDGTKGAVELAHEKGRKITFDDTGIRMQDEKGNSFKIDSDSGAITIEAKGQLKIKAASISIEATGTCNIKAGPMLNLESGMIHIN
jgi:uncharacterized protein involved in type VI secretion and phage assembly